MMIDITNQIQEYVNEQNKGLWEFLNEFYEFRLFHDPNDYSWKVGKEQNIVSIYANNLEINYSSFTHELLHVYIEHLGMPNYETVKENFISEPIFSNMFFNFCFSSIYNSSSHKKMFPYYSDMGFSEYNFVEDRINYNLISHYQISIKFKIRKLRLLAITSFLGNFFALKNNVVKEDKPKCEKYLKKLEKIKPDLFAIANEFDTSWKDSNNLDYSSLFSEFTYKLKNWLAEDYSR